MECARPWLFDHLCWAWLTPPDTTRRMRNAKHSTLVLSLALRALQVFCSCLCIPLSQLCAVLLLLLLQIPGHRSIKCRVASRVASASRCKLSCTTRLAGRRSSNFKSWLHTHTQTCALTAVACCVWAKLVSDALWQPYTGCHKNCSELGWAQLTWLFYNPFEHCLEIVVSLLNLNIFQNSLL